MEVPWAQAVQVGVVGFVMVFLLLIILGVVMWLTGLIFGETTGDIKGAAEKKGE
jgi:Na+-transporting methylmalonyl-CoA/oxaloacetate decarboxylase gamma subunit